MVLSVLRHVRPRAGIVAMHAHIPANFVAHDALEASDGVAKGKYTVGLMQRSMAVCDTNEDVVSMSMNAVAGLFERWQLDAADVRRVEVGHESPVDKSKSVKTFLMPLLKQLGAGHDIEGTDCINACYGGTQALLNAIAWTQSPAYDGGSALVVTGDIATYNAGPARATGGAGCVAMLVRASDHVPVWLETPRASFCEHAWDFYKPDSGSDYPRVDGHGSIELYQRALASCYRGWQSEARTRAGLPSPNAHIFHMPFAKMAKNACDSVHGEDAYDHMTEPSTRLGRVVGNAYAGSAWLGVLSHLLHAGLAGQRVGVFSYGSGAMATMLSLRVALDARSWLYTLRANVDLGGALASRTLATPAQFKQALDRREQRAPPSAAEMRVRSGEYFLKDVCQQTKQRLYERAA
jgi:hydroxymethylglutaryl-CoA synthase